MAIFLKKIILVKGDITKLKVDVIVNAANKRLLGGGGVDGAIHNAAGEQLLEECRTLNGCEVGDVKITKAYEIDHIRAIIHAVGPIWNSNNKDVCYEKLANCYKKSLNLAKEQNLPRIISFPCISTGIYSFPNEEAAEIALNVCKEWLSNKENFNWVEKIIFCTFLEKDYLIYEKKIPIVFPNENN